jgi:hypothetical protein
MNGRAHPAARPGYMACRRSVILTIATTGLGCAASLSVLNSLSGRDRELDKNRCSGRPTAHGYCPDGYDGAVVEASW